MREKIFGAALVVALAAVDPLALSHRKPPAPKGKAAGSAEARSGLEARVRRVLADALGIAESGITAKSRIVEDLGADSLAFVEVLMGLEEEFGITLSEEDCAKMTTVGEACDLVESLVKRGK